MDKLRRRELRRRELSAQRYAENEPAIIQYNVEGFEVNGFKDLYECQKTTGFKYADIEKVLHKEKLLNGFKFVLTLHGRRKYL